MKIGMFGNANNYPFMLARALRRMGHEVLFIVDRSPRTKWEILNRPENRYEDITLPYPDWIYDASPLDLWNFPSPPPERAKVARLLQSCDAVILNEFGLSLLPDIRRSAIALLTGTDLEVLANFQYADYLVRGSYGISSFLRIRSLIRRFIRKRFLLKLISAQREGIRLAVAVNYFARGLVPHGDALLDEIGVRHSQRIFFMMTDLELIQLQPMPHNPILRTFCGARLTWKKPAHPSLVSELDCKGSDIMIRGLGLFARTTGIPLDIRLVKKGAHIAETMQLIEEEGIASQVTWREEMSQQDVLTEYKQADIIFEQLGMSMVGMGGLDAMAMGRPVIANGRPEIMEQVIGVPSPICQAATSEEVCAQLQRLVPSLAERERVGLASRRYIEEYFSAERAAQICLDRLSRVLR